MMGASVVMLIHHFGRPFDHFLIGLRIPLVLCSLAVLVSVLAIRSLKTPPGMMLAAFCAWMTVITPFSTWRGGSFLYVRDFVLFWLVLFMLLACAPKTFSQFRMLFAITALASIAQIFFTGEMDPITGRLELRGAYGNSDDAAILAGFAIPFCLFLAAQIKNRLVHIALAAVSTAFLVRAMMLTATRSVLISLACLVLLWFIRTPGITRVFGALVLALGIIALWVSMPASTLERLKTTFSAFSPGSAPSIPGDAINGEAMDSAHERHDLFWDGVNVTFSNPILGVGPGQFGQYRWGSLSTALERKTWFKTHMTYLEVSSGTGIPGMLLYLGFVIAVFRSINKLRKATLPQTTDTLKLGYQVALCLEMAFIFFVVTAAFMTVEEHVYLFALAGFAIAAERVANAELARMAANPPKPAPAPPANPSAFRQWSPKPAGTR